MIRELRKSLKGMKGEIDNSDALFYSGTKPHLSLFVIERGFERILSFRDDSLQMHINTLEVGKPKIHVSIYGTVPEWAVESVLIVHGMKRITDG